MNLFNKKKKGFTIVELVIVIAVIGVLAAILIPTFVGLVNKAHVAADGTLVRELNNAIAMDLAEKGEDKHETMYDALQATEKNGFVVQRIKSKTNTNKILWDSVHGVFCYLQEGAEIVEYVPGSVEEGKELHAGDYRLWTISNAVDPTYSTYLYKATAKTFTTDKGLDVGDEDVTSVTYEHTTGAAQEVVIRTNGGELTVNAPADTVRHYGEANKVDVQAVANASYHEKGEVDLIKVKKGHVELEADAQVLGVYVYNDSTETTKDTSFEEIKITVKAGAEVPQLSRSAVEIQSTGTKVCTIVTDQAKDIYLFSQGIYEQIKTVDEGKNVATDASATWADNNANSANTQTAAQQLANELNASFTVGDTTYTVEVVEREVVVKQGETTVTGEALDAVIAKAVDQSGSSEDDAVAELPLRGDGLSWETAFEIYDYATMQKINEFYDVGYRYFKVVIEKTNNGYIDCKNWIPVNLNGSIDGKGVKIINLDKSLFMDVDGESVAISNFDITANISVSGGVSAVVGDDCNSLNLVIDNVNVHGTIIGASWVVSYVTFGPGPSNAWNCTIKNSVSDATLVATSGVASGFVGHPYDDVSNGSVNGKSLITIIDSAYIGNMSATGNPTSSNNYNFKYFTINGNDNRVKTYYSEEFIERLGFNPEGALYAVPTNATNYPVIINEDGSKTFFCGNYGKNVVDHYIKPYSKAQLNTAAKAVLPANVGDVFTVTKVSGATKAVVSLLIAPNDSNNYGSYLGTYMTEEIDITAVETNSTFTSENVKYFTININSGVTTETGVNGDIFNVVNSYYGLNAHNGATVQITQFDTNGNVLNITSIKIASAHAAE